MNIEHLNNLKEQKNEKKDSAPAYVFEKHRELVCYDCQGRGECFFIDLDRDRQQKAQEVRVARYFLSSSHHT